MSSPSQLFSCVDSAAIHNSPLNKSPTKNQYSFSKEKRFQLPLPYCDNIYQIPTTKIKISAKFGTGYKTNLDDGKHPHNITPSPDRYQIDSFVDVNKTHSNGFTTAIGRQLTKPRSYIQLDRIKFPGPGRYQEFRFNESPKWTTRQKTNKYLFQPGTTKIVPGAGTYEFNQSFNPQGTFYHSKHRNSLSKVWNPKSSERFAKSSTGVPGAGTYQPVNDISDSGKYVLSKNLGDGRRKFGHQFRNSFVDTPAKITKTPGPGKYRLPSDFGQYDEINLLQKSTKM